MCKLLIVDDNLDKLDRYVVVAGEVGLHDVVTATDADGAYRCIQSQRFDLAVVDILLSPSGDARDGLRTIWQLRRIQPGCRIIAITSRGRSDLGVEAINAGADDFICGEWKYLNWQELLRQRLMLWSTGASSRQTGAVCPC